MTRTLHPSVLLCVASSCHVLPHLALSCLYYVLSHIANPYIIVLGLMTNLLSCHILPRPDILPRIVDVLQRPRHHTSFHVHILPYIFPRVAISCHILPRPAVFFDVLVHFKLSCHLLSRFATPCYILPRLPTSYYFYRRSSFNLHLYKVTLI
jgi:hypothetical protein